MIVGPPEEGEKLMSTAGGPGQIHAVVASIRGHHEAALTAAVRRSIVVDSEAKRQAMVLKIAEVTLVQNESSMTGGI